MKDILFGIPLTFSTDDIILDVYSGLEYGQTGTILI